MVPPPTTPLLPPSQRPLAEPPTSKLPTVTPVVGCAAVSATDQSSTAIRQEDLGTGDLSQFLLVSGNFNAEPLPEPFMTIKFSTYVLQLSEIPTDDVPEDWASVQRLGDNQHLGDGRVGLVPKALLEPLPANLFTEARSVLQAVSKHKFVNPTHLEVELESEEEGAALSTSLTSLLAESHVSAPVSELSTSCVEDVRFVPEPTASNRFSKVVNEAAPAQHTESASSACGAAAAALIDAAVVGNAEAVGNVQARVANPTLDPANDRGWDYEL